MQTDHHDLRAVASGPIPDSSPGPSSATAHYAASHNTPLVAAATESGQPVSSQRQVYAEAGQQRYEQVATDVEQAIEEQYPSVDERRTEELAALLATLVLQTAAGYGLNPSSVDGDVESWVASTIEQSYNLGIQEARQQLANEGYDYGPTNLRDRLALSSHAEAWSATKERQDRLWKSVADDIHEDVEQTVTKYASQDRSVDSRTMASAVKRRVETIGQYRADLIGSTEPSRAFHDAQLTEWKALGFTEVSVEWKTVGDSNVCADCRAGAASSPYSIEEAAGLLPHHPRCRCWLSVVTSSRENQPR